MFRKKYKRTPNPLRRYYLSQVFPTILVALCIPVFPSVFSFSEGNLMSRYLLLILPLLILFLGFWCNRRLRIAAIQDAALRQSGEEALNASTVLQLSTVILLFLNAVAIILLFAAAYKAEITFPIASEVYQHVAAVAVGLTICFYGYFLPLVPHGHILGIQTPYTLSTSERWSACHNRSGKVLLVGGGVLFLLNEFIFLPTVTLAITVAVAVALLLICYFYFCKASTRVEQKSK